MISRFKAYIPAGKAKTTESDVSESGDIENLKQTLVGMDFEQLSDFAKEKGIDIGKVTTAPSALERIIAHLESGMAQ